jgi:outer membrane biogenesis lipoprotein LolB
MRTLTVLSLAVLFLAGCATPVNQPPAAPVPAPPLPAPLAIMKKQSVRAFAAASASFTSTSDTTSTNWGTVTKFAVTNELGQKSIGVRLTWPNWPTNTSYSIQVSTNLIDWHGIISSRGDAGATVEVIDQERVEFYRIAPAWFSGP